MVLLHKESYRKYPKSKCTTILLDYLVKHPYKLKDQLLKKLGLDSEGAMDQARSETDKEKKPTIRRNYH